MFDENTKLSLCTLSYLSHISTCLNTCSLLTTFSLAPPQLPCIARVSTFNFDKIKNTSGKKVLRGGIGAQRGLCDGHTDINTYTDRKCFLSLAPKKNYLLIISALYIVLYNYFFLKTIFRALHR